MKGRGKLNQRDARMGPCVRITPLSYCWDIQDIQLKDTDSPVPFSDLNHRVSEV